MTHVFLKEGNSINSTLYFTIPDKNNNKQCLDCKRTARRGSCCHRTSRRWSGSCSAAGAGSHGTAEVAEGPGEDPTGRDASLSTAPPITGCSTGVVGRDLTECPGRFIFFRDLKGV